MKAYFEITLMVLLFHFETAFAQANTLNLEDFLRKVQTQSPEIKAEKSLNEEFKAKAQGVRISPPMVGLMNMKDSGGNNQGFEVTQELPFPSKIIKEKEVRDLEAKTQNVNFFYKKNAILLEARRAYFEFWKSYETKKNLEEKQIWLKNHVKLSRSVARSDSSGQIHLLSVESEADQLENELLEAQTDLVEKTNALKIYVPDIKTENLIPDSLPKTELATFTISSKSLFVEAKESELKAASAVKDLKKQSYLPDLVLRYRSYNGNDMTPRNEEVMVGVTLPFLFYWQPQSEIAEASARQQRAEVEVQKAYLSIETQLNSLVAKSKAMNQQIENLKNKLIPRAQKRIKLVQNLIVRNMESLDEHRMVMLDYLELRQKEINLRLEFEKINIEILKIVNNQQQDKL